MGELVFLLLGLSIFGAAFASGGDAADPTPDPDPDPDPEPIPTPAEDLVLLATAQGTYSLSGTSADELIQGREDNEFLDGRAGGDFIEGFAGNDSLYGDDGADTLLGGDGDDFLNGGTGADVIFAGAGDDLVSYVFGADEFDGDRVTLGTGQDTVEIFFESDDAIDEPLTLTDFDVNEDILALTFILPFVGITEPDDYPEVVLQPTSDGSGTEFLLGSAKVAIFEGLTPDQLTDPVTGLPVDALQIDFTNSPNLTGDPLNITGSPFNDVIDGSSLDDTLRGGGGDDTLIGYGNTLIFGGEGDDFIPLWGEIQTVDAGPGNDVIEAETGDGDTPVEGGDILTLGEGTDEFRLTINGYPSFSSNTGFEPFPPFVLTDFDPGEDLFNLDYKVKPVSGSGPLTQPVFSLAAIGSGDTELSIDGVPVAIFQGLSPADLTDAGTGDLVPALDLLAIFTTAEENLTITGTDGVDGVVISAGGTTLSTLGGPDQIDIRNIGAVVDLGAGDDIVSTTLRGDFSLTLGDGVDEVLLPVKAAGTDSPAVITDFDPAEDVLTVTRIDALGPAETDVTFEPNPDGISTDMLVNGAYATTLQGLTPDQLVDPDTGALVAAIVVVA